MAVVSIKFQGREAHLASEPRWTDEKEEKFAYLWYLGIRNGRLLGRFLSEDSHYCNNKKSCYPRLDKYSSIELLRMVTCPKHSFTSWEDVAKCAGKVFKNTPKNEFETGVKALRQRGIKSPGDIYQLWKNRYNTIPALPSEAVSTFLIEVHLYKKPKYYAWIPAEMELYKRHKIDVNSFQLARIFERIEGREMIEAAVYLKEMQSYAWPHGQDGSEVGSIRTGFSSTE